MPAVQIKYGQAVNCWKIYFFSFEDSLQKRFMTVMKSVFRPRYSQEAERAGIWDSPVACPLQKKRNGLC